MRPEQEVSQVDKLAVILVLDVDDAPPVLATTDLLAVDDDVLLGADDSEGNEVLESEISKCKPRGLSREYSYIDLSVHGPLLLIMLVTVVRVHLQVVKGELLLDALLERLALLERQGVSLGNNGHHVDHIGQLLQHDNVDGLQGVASGLDEEQAAVNAGILDVLLAVGGELLAQVGRVLIFDVLDDGVPAAVVVDQVAVARCVDNVQAQADTILLDEVGHGVDLGSGADDLVRHQTTLGLNKVGGEDGVDKGRLSESSLTCNEARQGMLAGGADQLNHLSTNQALSRETSKFRRSRSRRRTNTDDVELEATLQELALDLAGDAVETDVALGVDGRRGSGCHFCCGCLGRGNEVEIRATLFELMQTNGCLLGEGRWGMLRISREWAATATNVTERVKLFCSVVVWAKIASFGDLRAATARASQFGVLEIGLLCLQDPVDNFGKGVLLKAARSSGACVRGLQSMQGCDGGSVQLCTAIPAPRIELHFGQVF